MDRRRLTQDELLNRLREQMRWLRRSADAFDAGDQSEAKRLATIIRTLVSDEKRAKSLLRLLDIKHKMTYTNTAPERNPRNVLSDNLLCVMKVTIPPGGTVEVSSAAIPPLDGTSSPVVSEGAEWEAPLESVPRLNPKPFQVWWKSDVMKDMRGRLYSRSDLTYFARSQDGGGHVDASLDSGYDGLASGNALGWIYSSPAGDSSLANSPVLPAIRQIAFELEDTLVQQLPGVLPRWGSS